LCVQKNCAAPKIRISQIVTRTSSVIATATDLAVEFAIEEEAHVKDLTTVDPAASFEEKSTEVTVDMADSSAGSAEAAVSIEEPVASSNAAYLLTFLGFLAWPLNEFGGKASNCKTAVTRILEFLTFVGEPSISSMRRFINIFSTFLQASLQKRRIYSSSMRFSTSSPLILKSSSINLSLSACYRRRR